MSNRPNAKPSSASRVAYAQQGERSYALPIILAVVVVAAAAIAFFATRNSDTESGQSTEIPEKTALNVQVTGTALAPYANQPPAQDPATGKAMPTAAGSGLDSQPLTVGPSGNPGLVLYLAHWCPHCQREVPTIVSWMEAGKAPANFDLQAVTTGIDEKKPNYPPSSWLKKERWTIPTLIDPRGEASEAAGLSGFPFYVWYDAQGNVVARASGELDTATIEQFNAMAMAGGSSPEATAPAGAASPAP
jgi:thiol-disulfide isomerase/thioredoxin